MSQKPTRKPTQPGKPRHPRPPAGLAVELARGTSYNQIGKIFGVDPEAVSRWAKQPAIKKQVEKINGDLIADAKTRIRALVHPALDGIQAVLSSGDICPVCKRGGTAEDKDKLKAAEIVFDRTGLPKTTRQEVSTAPPLQESEAEQERLVLRVAAEICRMRGQIDLALALEKL